MESEFKSGGLPGIDPSSAPPTGVGNFADAVLAAKKLVVDCVSTRNSAGWLPIGMFSALDFASFAILALVITGDTTSLKVLRNC